MDGQTNPKNRWEHIRDQIFYLYNFFVTYSLLCVPSFLFFSLIWTEKVQGTLYVCRDHIPFLSFFPPFVHHYKGEMYLGDAFLTPPVLVYALWIVFVIFIFVIPLSFILLLVKKRR